MIFRMKETKKTDMKKQHKSRHDETKNKNKYRRQLHIPPKPQPSMKHNLYPVMTETMFLYDTQYARIQITPLGAQEKIPQGSQARTGLTDQSPRDPTSAAEYPRDTTSTQRKTRPVAMTPTLDKTRATLRDT